MKYRLVACLFFLVVSLPVFSQTSSKRCKWITITPTPFILDSLTVVPGSISFSNYDNTKFSYSYNPATNQFQFKDIVQPMPVLLPDSLGADSLNVTTAPLPDSVMVCYRVLPLNLALVRFRRQRTRIDSLRLPPAIYTETIRSTKEEIFNTPGLNKTGTVTRGISLGNRQNVFVNSALNLQLEGKLSDDINIVAAITDQNIPFQPEGNTQQLQEFDKVYITLQHRLWNITGGDVVLQNKPNYFLRFYKNVQGGVLEVNQNTNPRNNSSTTVAASVAKGKFASIAVTAVEGVQGPYRPTGPNGEKFILILANSERVYVDGVLLTRGFDFDYVIDYNQAEITFTARRLITKYSRIRVDFEYSDRNYNRSIYHASHYQKINKLGLNFNVYNEADNPNNLLALDLQNSEKLLLKSIGDSLSQAFTSGAEKAIYNLELILYKDSTVQVNGMATPIYIYTQDSTLANYYTVGFTDVGTNQGDYIQRSTTVNGRIYQYVPPQNGIRQGQYLPVRILPTPRKKQMLTAGGNYQLDKETSIFLETAASDNDLNRFSTRDSQDDKGNALRVGYVMEDKAIRFLSDYKLRSAFSYEYTGANFEPIDRYRDVEFNRDWSVPLNPESRASDNILQFAIGAHKNLDNLVNYRFSQRYRAQEIAGSQHYLDAARQFRGMQLRSNFFLLDAAGPHSQSDWVRGNIEGSYLQGKVVPGYVYRFDKNRVYSLVQPDSIIQSAMYFDEHTFFVRSQDTAATRYRLDYTYRQDRAPQEGRLGAREISQTYRGVLQTKIGLEQDVNIIATYRLVNNRDSINESAILSTVSWLGNLLNRHLRSEMDYTVATGREARRQYEFVEVAPGQGTHYLIQGGNPQNLNDYFEAQVPDAVYRTHIKVYLPTDEYVKAFTNQFNYRLNSAMPRNWQGKAGLRNFASKFSAVTYLTINKKTTDTNLWRRFNPFGLDVEDSLLISLSSAFRNTIFYNRSDPTFGLEFTLQQNQQKVLLANGTDVRNINSGSLIGRYNLNQFISSKLTLSRYTRESLSNYLSTKNFSILGYDLSPEVSFQPTNALRFTGTYLFTQKQNEQNQETPEEAFFHELGIETRISQVSKRTVTGNLRYINVVYTGDESAAIAYEMLNALRPGNNLTWNFILQQRLSNGLNISFNYDGRKPNGAEVIHLGRMQVSVLF